MNEHITTSLNSSFEFICQDERFKLLEEKVFRKKKRPEATAPQRFLAMYYSKALDPIIQNTSISQNTKNELVAAILDIDPDNAKKYLAELVSPRKLLLRTKTNYEFLVNFFIKPGQENILQEVEKILVKIIKDKENL